MIKIKNLILFFIIISIASVAFWHISTYRFSLYGNRTGTVTIANSEFRVEVVSSGWKMQRGLGKRNGLCDECAMLFKFSQAGNYPFCMKDMRFPLDIIWIFDGKIVHIEKNISENFSGILSPKADADIVVEINAGIVDKMGMKMGDQVTFKY